MVEIIYDIIICILHLSYILFNKHKLKKKKKLKKNSIVYSPFHKRAFCYIDDAVEQIIALTLKNNNNNKIFNIGNMKEEIKIIDLAKKIKKLVFM